MSVCSLGMLVTPVQVTRRCFLAFQSMALRCITAQVKAAELSPTPSSAPGLWLDIHQSPPNPTTKPYSETQHLELLL